MGYANKEDMGILNTTLAGIVNMLSGLDNKLADLKSYITKMKGGSTYQKNQGGSGEKKKTRQTDSCYICN